MKKKVAYLLDGNDLQQKVLAKQIRLAEQKHLDHLRRSEFAKMAANGRLKEIAPNPPAIDLLAAISSTYAISKSTQQLSALYFKRQWLEHEQVFLEKQLSDLKK